ncbi:Peptidase U4, sporulation factor SpoIIGA [Syntrophomonas zehnderi OL-4]|uniref:Sporulation sigma-E factor-processing peptidase n=1 Tax=Syntrophomonas zehnderi OL-4 TaxID=690567 RepID=A0A0E3W392_9FIRM|nr:sigma-E processing peptidase SpoIIGA [Syntrophomonas zehnderi]CFX63548.1 Peptidase U4, sporulation factor SpoIIGA [Syntrophomonas zehnderi OL-4]
MNEPKVYADLTFLINFILDFLILWASARLSRIRIKYPRLLLASFLGGVYAVGYLFDFLMLLYCLPAKLTASVVLILLAFGFHNWQKFKQVCLYFYGISCAVAGASLAVPYLLPHGSQPVSWSYLYLLAGIICVLIIGFWAEKYLNQTLIPALLKYPVSIRFGDLICRGEGFLDTGNGLRDPLTQRPIVVAEYALLKTCLPEDFKLALENHPDENERLEAISMSTWSNRMRLIPFSSIGKKNGLLIGVRCDEMVVNLGKKKLQHKNLVVGIYPHKLTLEDDYQMLIPSEVVYKG